MKKSFALEARADMTCKAKETVSTLIDEGKALFTTILGAEKQRGRFPLFIDEESDASHFAQLISVTDTSNGDILNDDDIEDIIEAKSYKIMFSSRDGRDFHGQIEVDYAESNTSTSTASAGEYEELITEKVAEGIMTKAEADARIKVLVDNHVDDSLIRAVIRWWKKFPVEVKPLRCLYVDPELDEMLTLKREGKIAIALRCAIMGQSIICEGEKSTGKNVFAETIAWLLAAPLFMIGFSARMSPSSIYGDKTTDNSAAEKLKAFDPTLIKQAEMIRQKREMARNMLSDMTIDLENYLENMDPHFEEDEAVLLKVAEFEKAKAQAQSVNITIDPSQLYDWMVTGGVMVWNEMDMCDPNLFQQFAHPIADGTGFLFFPGRGNVPISPNCVLIGNQNGDYAGAQVQNEATKSRFNTLRFPQPKSIKKQLINAVRAELDAKGFSEIVLNKELVKQTEKFYKECRRSVGDDSIEALSNACLNIRGCVRAITAVASSGGVASLKQWLGICVVESCPMDERDSLYGLLEAIVSL